MNMKNHESVERRVTSAEGQTGSVPRSICARSATSDSRLAFTLIELLVVMAIIGALAALLLAVAAPVKTKQKILNTRAEMDQTLNAGEK